MNHASLGKESTGGRNRLRALAAENSANEKCFEIVGPSDAPVVVVLGGISASRHVTATPSDPRRGWWDAFVGPDRVIDTNRYRVLSMDYRTVGRNGGPPTTDDQALALVDALDAGGIVKARAIVGASYGGMVALAFGALAPQMVEQLVVIGAAHESAPIATALRVLQRRIVELGIVGGCSHEALVIARGLAMTTYASAEEFSHRFGRADDQEARDTCREIGDFLTLSGKTFANTCTPARFLALSESLDLHSVRPEDVSVPATLIAVEEDTLVPVGQVRELAARIGAPCRLFQLHSRHGHDTFLHAPTLIAPFVARSLEPKLYPLMTETLIRDLALTETIKSVRTATRASTRAVRAGIATDQHHGAVIPPLHLSSTFAFEGFGKKGCYDYTRTGNPTRDHLARALAQLEGGESAIVTSTGMSAVLLVLQLVRPDDVIIASHDCYGGTHRILRSLAERGHFDAVFEDLTSPWALDVIADRRPRLLWVETPSNPLLRITDIARVAKVGHAAGSIVAVDNTFLSPALQRPIEFGADVVVHSTTKYLNGHSDVVGGAVIARDAAVAEELAWWANCLGITGAPFDSYLTLRGVRTLEARMRIHLENAAMVVKELSKHHAVSRVYYPGLPTHPGHAIADAQQDGFGAMVSFEVEGGLLGVERFLQNLQCFTLAESLGGVESLVAHPATMTHASMDEATRARAGIEETLLRLSVGIEHGEDLVEDIRFALDAVIGE